MHYFCRVFVLAVLLLAPVLSLNAKEQTESPQARLERLANEAAQRAANNTVDANEIDMIKYRRILNGKPGLQMYVVFLSRSGQPVDYFVTQGKCVSSTKRLTPTHNLFRTSNYHDVVLRAAAEDGTFGSSSPYIYCKTVDGKYKQWNGRYYVSDAPIELTIKPLIIETSGKIQSQQ